jgi:hypothetical protein
MRKHPVCPNLDCTNSSYLCGRAKGGPMGGDLHILQLSRIIQYFQKCLLEAPDFAYRLFFPLIMRAACEGYMVQVPDSIKATGASSLEVRV